MILRLEMILSVVSYEIKTIIFHETNSILTKNNSLDHENIILKQLVRSDSKRKFYLKNHC